MLEGTQCSKHATKWSAVLLEEWDHIKNNNCLFNATKMNNCGYNNMIILGLGESTLLKKIYV